MSSGDSMVAIIGEEGNEKYPWAQGFLFGLPWITFPTVLIMADIQEQVGSAFCLWWLFPVGNGFPTQRIA